MPSPIYLVRKVEGLSMLSPYKLLRIYQIHTSNFRCKPMNFP